MTPTHVIVNMGEDGDVKCFCPYEEYLRVKGDCRSKFDCAEAILDVRIVAGSKPSEQTSSAVTVTSMDIKKASRDITRSARKIKEGLARFEKSVRGSKFRL